MTGFALIAKMVEENNKAVMMAPLTNIVRMQKVRAGTQVTIGVPGDMLVGLTNGDYVGGLLLVRRDEYERQMGK